MGINTVDTLQPEARNMSPGGGYCFAPTHYLQDNTPVENVIAMYHAVHQYGE